MNRSSHPTSDSVSAPVDDTVVQDEGACARSQGLSSQMARPPGIVSGYEIIRSLGEGSFGSVWLAREVNTGKQVAIKFYSHRRGLDWSLLSREVEKLAVLYTSRNVVGLLGVGWDHDPPYFVMEYLENGSLAQVLRNGPLPPEQAVRIAQSIARALVHAHGSGILHCDVKPANVLLDGNQEARLGDFGQSRLSNDQSPALGTLFYMSPEQADLEAVPDARWDVYALGALLYHMLCGQAPFRTELNEARLRSASSLPERLATYQQIIGRSPLPDAHRQQPGVDRLLEQVVDRCLQPDPARRYPNAQAVLDALEQRDRIRAKRPLIALGFIGPLLFLLAMYVIARAAIPQAREAAQNNLLSLILQGDSVTAHILAGSIEQELTFRQDMLEALADTPTVRQLIAQAAIMTDEELLEACQQEVGSSNLESDPIAALMQLEQASDQRLRESSRTEDVSWFVTDAAGRQIFRVPAEGTIGDNFAYRDYFHGLGRELSEDADLSEIRPRKTPGMSLAFRSRATDKYMVAIAVPIWDEARETVIGILARTIHLTDLLDQWEGLIRGENRAAHERFLTLIDTRSDSGLILDHDWMTPSNLGGRSDVELQQILRIDPDQVLKLRSADFSDRYIDPIGHIDSAYNIPWLAAYAPVGETGWVAVVQESRTAALKPVEDLQSVFLRYGIAALVVFSVMLAILWYLIHRWST